MSGDFMSENDDEEDARERRHSLQVLNRPTFCYNNWNNFLRVTKCPLKENKLPGPFCPLVFKSFIQITQCFLYAEFL